MLISQIIEKLDLKVLSGERHLTRDVTCVYVSDILSDVMAGAARGSLWITNQTHENVIAIVFFKNLAGVILPAGQQLEQPALDKARDKQIPVFVSELSTFDLAGRLYQLGLRGCA